MEKIYSKIQPSILLHLIHRAEDFGEGRLDLVSPEHSLQSAALTIQKGTTFRAHKHNHSPRINTVAQEAWIIVRGKIRAFYFDLDDMPLVNFELGPGDITTSLAAGHTYEAVEKSLVYEIKSGPYLGQVADKTFI